MHPSATHCTRYRYIFRGNVCKAYQAGVGWLHGQVGGVGEFWLVGAAVVQLSGVEYEARVNE